MLRKKIPYKYDEKRTHQAPEGHRTDPSYHGRHHTPHHNNYENQPTVQFSSGGCCKLNKNNSIFQEFLCHLPMAILALSISLLCIVFFDGVLKELIPLQAKQYIYNDLFHVSHYIHILFASFASFFAFMNSFVLRNIFLGAFLALFNSFFFCTLADMVLPTLGGFILSYPVTMHFCFLHMQDLLNVFCFALFGIFAAYCLNRGNKQYALLIGQKVHIGHVWIGCIASLLYLLSQVTIIWTADVAFLLIILFFSVVIPCIISDICIPVLISSCCQKKNEFHNTKIEYH